MSRIKLKAPKGLGDAIFLRAIVLHFLEKGEQITIFTGWPDVFDDLPIKIRPESEFEKHPDIRSVSYSSGRKGSVVAPELISNDSAFSMACKTAGISEPVEFKMDWKVRYPELIDGIRQKAVNKKIFVYQMPRIAKNANQELLTPDRKAFIKIIDEHSDYFRIKMGHPPYVDNGIDAPCEMDMYGKAFIHKSFDIGTIADLLYGQSCFITQMAEAMDKRFICMIPSKAMNSDSWMKYYASPERVCHKRNLMTAVYDGPVA